MLSDARPKIRDPSKTAKDAAAYRRTMGRYRVAIIICRTHHSRQIARLAPSNVGTSAAGAYAILRPASRTARVSTKSSLSTFLHRSSSRRTGRRSRRTAQDPPQAKARRGSNNTFALTAFHSVRTRDQNVGVGGTYQRNPVATPTVESASGWTSCRSQSGAGRISESAKTTTSSVGVRWRRPERTAFTLPWRLLGSATTTETGTCGDSAAIVRSLSAAGSAESSGTTRRRYFG